MNAVWWSWEVLLEEECVQVKMFNKYSDVTAVASANNDRAAYST